MRQGWIGVDLDGTLAHYDGWVGSGHIGEPVPKMVARVKAWLSSGEQVRLFTARASHNRPTDELETFIKAWRLWSLKHIGEVLAVTAEKDLFMKELWDDRCVQVIANTGERADGLN